MRQLKLKTHFLSFSESDALKPGICSFSGEAGLAGPQRMLSGGAQAAGEWQVREAQGGCSRVNAAGGSRRAQESTRNQAPVVNERSWRAKQATPQPCQPGALLWVPGCPRAVLVPGRATASERARAVSAGTSCAAGSERVAEAKEEAAAAGGGLGGCDPSNSS